ncbi:MAG TPA: hypothetical protein VJ745_01730 [Gaiellaceae bacterium]|nr:hypothetical protein [Gaiellaceae bacterium]
MTPKAFVELHFGFAAVALADLDLVAGAAVVRLDCEHRATACRGERGLGSLVGRRTGQRGVALARLNLRRLRP